MKHRLPMALLALGLCSVVLAQEKPEYSRVSLVGTGSGKNTVSPDQFVILVVEGPYITYDKNPIPDTAVVEYVNNLLKVKNAAYVGVHTREGVKYGDVVRAIDVLRKTTAKDIGVSMVEIPVGINP